MQAVVLIQAQVGDQQCLRALEDASPRRREVRDHLNVRKRCAIALDVGADTRVAVDHKKSLSGSDPFHFDGAVTKVLPRTPACGRYLRATSIAVAGGTV